MTFNIKSLRELHTKTTQGEHVTCGSSIIRLSQRGGVDTIDIGYFYSYRDSEFAVAAHTHWTALLDEVESVQKSKVFLTVDETNQALALGAFQAVERAMKAEAEVESLRAELSAAEASAEERRDRAKRAELEVESLRAEVAFWKKQMCRMKCRCVSADCVKHGAYVGDEADRVYDMIDECDSAQRKGGCEMSAIQTTEGWRVRLKSLVTPGDIAVVCQRVDRDDTGIDYEVLVSLRSREDDENRLHIWAHRVNFGQTDTTHAGGYAFVEMSRRQQRIADECWAHNRKGG